MRVYTSLLLLAACVYGWRRWILGWTVREMDAEVIHAEQHVSIRLDWR